MQLNMVFRDWLHRRKITADTIERFGLYTKGDKLVIPIRDRDGDFFYNKYRRSPLSEEGPKYLYDKGGKLTLYGADQINDLPGGTVLWCEGEMDSLVAWSHNIMAVSGTGGAMSIGVEWKDWLYPFNVVICFDNDPAGGEGMAKAFDSLGGKCSVIFLPDRPGVKDISDYVTSGGDLNELMKTARSFNGLEDIIADRAERIAKWQSVHFHDAYIKNHAPKPKKLIRVGEIGIGGMLSPNDDVVRAKAHPIDDLIEFRQGKAPCIWHNERTGSMHYYSDTNTVYCFGCGKYGDAIDVYRQLNHCSFKAAVEALK